MKDAALGRFGLGWTNYWDNIGVEQTALPAAFQEMPDECQSQSQQGPMGETGPAFTRLIDYAIPIELMCSHLADSNRRTKSDRSFALLGCRRDWAQD
jgi:hypothetical protein